MSALAGILVCLVAAVTLAASSGSSHPCERPCLAGQSPRDCRYIFTLQPHVTMNRLACGDCPQNETDCFQPKCVTANGKVRTFFSVNGELPGPGIHVCLGDTVEVEVRNRLPAGAEGALHWHGLLQHGTPYMDGVPMLTQCPVPPGADFHYKFVAEQEGTYFYHAHSVLQQSDGVYGALIVRAPSKIKYEEDHVLIISPWSDEIQSGAYGVLHGDLLRQTTPTALLINGRGAMQTESGSPIQVARITAGKPSLLRLVNAASLDCPVQMTLASHVMRVLRVGGVAVRPVKVKSIQLFPGERYDVEVVAEVSGETLLRIDGSHMCSKTPSLVAILNVRDSDIATRHRQTQDLPVPEYDLLTSECPTSLSSALCALDLKAATDVLNVSENTELTYSLPFGQAPVSPVDRNDLEFRFVLDDVAYYPTFLKDAASGEDSAHAPHLNHVAFRLPASPPLVHPEDEEAISRGECESLPVDNNGQELPARRPVGSCRDQPHYCECTHVLRVPLNATVQLVLRHAISDIDDKAYAIHLHGYRFLVTAWHGADDIEWRQVTVPLMRDTVVVPRGGAVSLRLHANNSGFWLLEARAGHVVSAGVGMAVVLQVGEHKHMPSVPKDFPKCSGIKPEDVIF